MPEASAYPLPANIADLASTFSPHLWLHKKERYLPSSVEGFLHHSELWVDGALKAARGTVTAATLHPYQGALARNGMVSTRPGVHLKCSHDFQHGVPPAELPHARVYVQVRAYAGFVSMLYATFYPYNGAYSVMGRLMGGHEGDWEHVTVRIVKCAAQTSGWRVHSVWYHTHRERDGQLVDAKNMEFSDGTHPVAYVAVNGHGHYPSQGTWKRIWCFANDSCSRGTLWKPPVVLLRDTETVKAEGAASPLAWLLFSGTWGTGWDRGHGSLAEMSNKGKVSSPGNPPVGPASQGWWVHEPCRTRSTLKRIFMHSAS